MVKGLFDRRGRHYPPAGRVHRAGVVPPRPRPRRAEEVPAAFASLAANSRSYRSLSESDSARTVASRNAKSVAERVERSYDRQ